MHSGLRGSPRLWRFPALVLAAVLGTACPSGGGSGAPTVTGVSVTADAPRIAPDGTVRLVATVQGTGSIDPAVTWSIEQGGGSLSSDDGAEVIYRAPAAPDAPEALIRATSRSDPAQSATVLLTIAFGTVAGVVITAIPTTLSPGETTAMAALVDGAGLNERRVTWRVIQGPGQLHQVDGRSASFQADATFTGTVVLEAMAVADPSRSATVTLTVAPPATSVIRAAIRQPGCGVFSRTWTCMEVPAGDSSTVLASVASTYEVQVSARVPGTGIEAPLTINSKRDGYQGSLDLHSLDRGQYPLELSVTDARGNALVVPGIFVVDRAPALEVAEPATWQVAVASTLRVRASCQDDAGVCSLVARVESLQAAGTGTLDTTLELAAFAGRKVKLTVSAEDSLGQLTSRAFTVFVASPALEPVAKVPGQLLAADASRLLFATGDGPSAQPKGLGILQRASGQVSPLLTSAGSLISGAQLASTGAVFVAQPVGGTSLDRALYEATPDALTALDPGRIPVWVKARGDFALWTTYPESDLMLRRLSTGTAVRVAVPGNTEQDVTEQGFVAFWDKEYDILTYQDGVTRRLTNDPDSTVWNTYPVTDGTLVVYRKTAPCCSVQTGTVALHTGTQEILLTQPRPMWDVSPGRDYAVNSGWVAYTDLASGGQTQVWLRSPAGETRKITDWSVASTVEALGPGGQVAVRNVMDGKTRLLVSRGTEPLQDLGFVEGRAQWLDGAWHILWADTLFRVR
ncbi:hypothetical protein [Hyalangium minutum]|uniref:Uncharacterized protein n=1 Tax=Hyalangium minutum TaxID=394096 RepID=A0A085WFU4_9BACT|nr:hypothetical protein [Hyalangium minutum]KFE66557.1 hypothetical protein DB31_1030 [Hyalangium minutum]